MGAIRRSSQLQASPLRACEHGGVDALLGVVLGYTSLHFAGLCPVWFSVCRRPFRTGVWDAGSFWKERNFICVAGCLAGFSGPWWSGDGHWLFLSSSICSHTTTKLSILAVNLQNNRAF